MGESVELLLLLPCRGRERLLQQRILHLRHRNNLISFKDLFPKKQGQNLALTVLCVPSSLDSGQSSQSMPRGQVLDHFPCCCPAGGGNASSSSASYT